MKLLKKEAAKICEDYDLGKLKSFELVHGGAVNYNYSLTSSKGNFMIKILGQGLTDWMKNQLKIQFKIIEFLSKNNFKYQITIPLKNKSNKILSTVNDKHFWIYEKIKGVTKNKLSKQDYLEVVKVIAEYHKLVSKIKLKENVKNYEWLKKEYKKLKEVSPKNKIDKLMLEHVEDFEKSLHRILKINFNKNLVFNHMDFSKGNVLFEGKKIVGILDFDNVEYSPRISELISIMKRGCITKTGFDKKMMAEVIKEYERILKLTKLEKEMVFDLMILRYCNVFWWAYNGMKKNPEKRESYLKHIIKSKGIIEKIK